MGDPNGHDVDAIRYAVLRRLAPGLRHRLMGELQSLQFSGELAVRLLDAGTDAAKLAATVRQIVPLTRSATAASATLIEWLRGDDRATTTLDLLPQLVRLAGDDWPLRGIESTTDVRTGDARVARTPLRELIVTSLLALTDAQPGPLDIAVAAERVGGEVVVRLRAAAGQGTSPLPTLVRADAFGCTQVNALGAAHGVVCTCVRDEVTLRLPVVVPPDANATPGGEA
jgi:hypothetical protein